MDISQYSEKTLSLALVLGAAVWGLYWYPLRAIEGAGISGSWSVVFFNACPLIVLLPTLLFARGKLNSVLWPTLLAALLIGMAFTFYSNGLVETTVVRATLLYYLTPVWSTIVGVVWLSERLTKARIIAIIIAFIGLYLLIADGELSMQSFNRGDVYSLLSGILWAFGVAVLNRWATIPILPLTTFIFLTTTVISALFAHVLVGDALPDSAMVKAAFPTALLWSIVIILPGFLVIFRVSQVLFPGRVGILAMSEVVVAIFSASILLPQETLTTLQWVGAAAIIAAGLVEVLFGYSRSSDSASV